MNRVRFATRYLLFIILGASAVANAQSGGGYLIKKSTIGGGGGVVTGGGYRATGTVGQHDAGLLSGGAYEVTGGFWSPAPSGPACLVAAAPEMAQQDSNAGAGVTLVDLRNNRYLAIRAPGSAGRSQAIRVHLKTLPPPWDAWNGSKMFVAAPSAVCETSGVGPGGNCGAAPTFQLAGLSCDPGDAALLDWTTIPGGVVYVAHPGIVPNSAAVTAEYEIQMIDSTCDLLTESAYSTVKSVLGVKWGDVCGGFDPSGPYYVAANGSVDVAVDVTAALNKFGNRPGAPIKVRADVEPCLADAKINITDVTRILDGFRNLPFTFSPGGGFGCASSDPCTYGTILK